METPVAKKLTENQEIVYARADLKPVFKKHKFYDRWSEEAQNAFNEQYRYSSSIHSMIETYLKGKEEVLLDFGESMKILEIHDCSMIMDSWKDALKFQHKNWNILKKNKVLVITKGDRNVQ